MLGNSSYVGDTRPLSKSTVRQLSDADRMTDFSQGVKRFATRWPGPLPGTLFALIGKSSIICPMPTAILALNYWLHLLATVTWMGGLTVLTLVVWPGLTASLLQGTDAATVMDAIERRFRPIANLSLVVLLTTGIIQMSDDPHYKGFLVINSLWTWGLLIKHILIGVMIVISLATQGQLLPQLDRARLLALSGKASGLEQERTLRKRLRLMTTISLGLGILILLVTAVITAL